ncbi:MAG: CaiB/BaiF CoA-transferase family protein [Chloroflexota bacterium]|nr:CoA transferase [Dehalococcoidia bacterium]MDW8253035.1 CaiB/BaiF CoA-transferase family protein [Chloroflexota bacterium]
MPDRALEGIRVLDFGWHIAGPFATKLLADFGADVIKVERPGRGDPARDLGPFPPGNRSLETSATFLYLNTNKRSIVLDLAHPAGREVALRLAASADIVLENFRPGVMARLGLDHETLRTVNPDVITVSISNYGQTGPYAQYEATELTLWGHGEIPYITGQSDRPPLKTAGAQPSLHAGINACIGALAALWQRDLLGEAQYLDVSILEAVVNLIEFSLGLYQCLGLVHRRRRATVAGFHPAGRRATAKGDLFLMFGSRTGAEVAVALNLPELNDPRFATNALRYQHREEFDRIFLPWLERHTATEAFRLLQERARLPVAKVMTLADLFEDEQYRAREYFVDLDHPLAGLARYAGPPFKMSATPAQYRRPAPRLGEHTIEILREAGYSEGEIAQLIASGAASAALTASPASENN